MNCYTPWASFIKHAHAKKEKKRKKDWHMRVPLSRQGKLICIAQFRYKATQSAVQVHTNYIKRHKFNLKDIKNCIKKNKNKEKH